MAKLKILRTIFMAGVALFWIVILLSNALSSYSDTTQDSDIEVSLFRK